MKFKVFFLVVLIFLIGCGEKGGGGPEVELQKGLKGITLDIAKNGFPESVVEDERFYSVIELNNEGYSDVENGKFFFSLEKDFMMIESWDLPFGFRNSVEDVVEFKLKGRSIDNPNGEKQIIRTILNSRNIDFSRNKMKSRVLLNLCYPYRTVFSDTICIDTDPNGLSAARKTCVAKDLSDSGQGAPIAVTKVEQRMIPGNSFDSIGLELKITAENKGNGIVINKDKYEQVCLGKSENATDYNSITLKKILFFSDYEYKDGTGDFTCSPNPMRKSKGEYYTICRLNENSGIPKSLLTFETAIVIELEYGYKVSESKEVEIISREPGFFE